MNGPTEAGARYSHDLRQSRQWDFDREYACLLDAYASSLAPIAVNFRTLVALAPGANRVTHLLHSYPAKLLPHIPIFLLNAGQIGGTAHHVLDPFCGTGTTLLEAVLCNLYVTGADSNPLARLITEVKLTWIEAKILHSAHRKLQLRRELSRTSSFRPVVNPDLWFTIEVQRSLSGLLSVIRDIQEDDVRRFYEVCLSACVRKVSNADPRLSVPVRMAQPNVATAADVYAIFDRCVDANIDRVSRLRDLNHEILRAARVLPDARQIRSSGAEGGPDLVITSPPYVGAQKYVRSSSLSIGWLGLAPGDKLRNLERTSIGREHFVAAEYQADLVPALGKAADVLQRIRNVNPLRAHIANTYLHEMREALTTSCRALKPGGRFVLVIGDNHVCGIPFRTGQYLRDILEQLGLTLELELVDAIKSRGLMTKRNRTAGIIEREHVLVFQKCED